MSISSPNDARWRAALSVACALFSFLGFALFYSTPLNAQTAPVGLRYDMGSYTVRDIWVDPVNGNDENTGANRDRQALRTITAAWSRIPEGRLTTTGYRIMLVAGEYGEDHVPEWMSGRRGTARFPVIFQSADGRGRAVITRAVNFQQNSYLYLLGVDFLSNPGGGNIVQLAGNCDHILIRESHIVSENAAAQEALKANQCQYVYIEDSEIAGANNVSLDFMVTQYGHIVRNKIHTAGDWCIYLKGGSAYFQIEQNEIYNCNNGGFSAGQGSGFDYMVSPWLHYDAYDLKFVNNTVHDTQGAGIGVQGGYNILFAHNTLYRVGQNSIGTPLVLVAYGSRICEGSNDAPTNACRTNHTARGWGAATPDSGGEMIPNRNVYVYNNLMYNPSDRATAYAHFAIYSPMTPPSGRNIPSPAQAHTNLQIKGNLIWNGPADHSIGISEGACPAGSTCTEELIRRENTINSFEPELENVTSGNFRPRTGSNIARAATYAIPNFSWNDAPLQPLAPTGQLTNSVTVDWNGVSRTSRVVGAYTLSGSTTPAPAPTPSPTPTPAPAPTPSPSPTPTPTPSPTPAPAPTPTPEPLPPEPDDDDVLSTDIGVTIAVTPSPAIRIGANARYTITVRNHGENQANEIVLTMEHPTNSEFVSIESSQGSCEVNGAIACNLGLLEGRERTTLTLIVQTERPGALTAQVNVESETPDTNEANNEATITTTIVDAPRPDLVVNWRSLTKQCRPRNGVVRCTLQGRVRVRNQGNARAKGSHLALYLSENASLDDSDSAIQTIGIPALGPNAEREVKFTYLVPTWYSEQNFTIIGLADARRRIQESNERNNASARTTP